MNEKFDILRKFYKTHSVKTTRTYNEDPLLDLYAQTLRKTGNFLISRINANKVTVHNNTLYESLTFTIELPDEEK